MAGTVSQNRDCVFDGFRFNAKYKVLINHLKTQSITKRDQVKNMALLSYVMESMNISETEAGSYLREFRTILEFSETGNNPVKQWDDALGKIVPVYKIFNESVRTVCHSHDIYTLYDLLSLPENILSRYFHKDSGIVEFVKTSKIFPVTGLTVSDSIVMILHRNGIRTVGQLVMTGHSFLSCLPGMNVTIVGEVLESLSKLPERVAYYQKLLDEGLKIYPFIFDNEGYVLYVYQSPPCRWKKHDYESATGYLGALDGTPVKININYCKTCDQCFIDFFDYENYRNKYGPLLGNLYFGADIVSSGTGGIGDGWNDKSPLSLCGYNVNKQTGLSKKQRHRILASIMDHKILTKSEITDNYLKLFIKSRRNNPIMREAIRKWEEDIDWVNEYKIDEQRHYIIIDIQ